LEYSTFIQIIRVFLYELTPTCPNHMYSVPTINAYCQINHHTEIKYGKHKVSLTKKGLHVLFA